MDGVEHTDDVPAPLLGARRAWPSLCYGTVLSCLAHTSAIAAILFGFPILHLVIDQPEPAAASLTVVSVPQEETQAFGETGVKSDHVPNDDIRKGGEQFIADSPESKKIITETSDTPTTKGGLNDNEPTPDNGVESERAQSDPTPNQDNKDHLQQSTQTANDGGTPQPTPQEKIQPSQPKSAQSEQKPSGATVVLVNAQAPTPDQNQKTSSEQTATTETKTQTKTPSATQSVEHPQTTPAKSTANASLAAKSSTDAGPTQRNPSQAEAAQNPTEGETDASGTGTNTTQTAQRTEVAQASEPAKTPADNSRASDASAPPTPQPLTRNTAIIAAPTASNAPTSVAPTPAPAPADPNRNPLPPPRTPSQVVDQLADALPRIATIRNGILAARKRPPGAMVAAADASQSVERLEKFAEQGYAHAQFALAEMMLTGEGLPRNPAKGKELAIKAALNGYLPAQILLGALAADGGSVDQPRDLGEAQAWLTLAAGNDSKAAALAVKSLTPMLEVKDIIHSKQRQSELRQLSALAAPQTNSKLSSKEAGDRLRQAAALGDLETVTIMLTQGADADSSDEDGRTALIEASWRGYSNIVATLVQQGANVGQVDASGKSPLAWAAINGYATVAKMLLDAGQNPDLPDVTGVTALMRAAWNDRPSVVKVLLDRGANPNLHDSQNMTALDYANREKHSDVIYLLRGITK